jgi:hypothetical protein
VQNIISYLFLGGIISYLRYFGLFVYIGYMSYMADIILEADTACHSRVPGLISGFGQFCSSF